MERNAQEQLNDRTDLKLAAYNVQTVRAMERPLLERGVPLMRMAARATAQEAAELLEQRGISVADANVVLLAGAGDNGGDGLFAAAHLARAGATVTVVAVGKTLHPAGLIALTHAGGKLLVLNADSQIPGASSGFGPGEAGERLEAALDIAREADLVLDAMTGIGIKGALRGLAATIASALGRRYDASHGAPDNDADGAQPTSDSTQHVATAEKADNGNSTGHSPLVVAVDTPSGVGVDDGTLPGPYIPADVTMMFGAMKPCAMLPPAAYICGKVVLVDFGFDTQNHAPVVQSVQNVASQAIRRPKTTDGKYNRGVVGLITGSSRYPGAALLSSRAAAHANVGMIRYIGPADVAGNVVSTLPEAVIGKGHVQAWVVGSGIPDANHAQPDDPQRAAIKALLAHYDMASSANDASNMPPICVDAGALDLLPGLVPPQVVLTPHAGELAQLLQRRGESISRNGVEADPQSWARKAHELTGATVLLKGAVTVVQGNDCNDDDRKTGVRTNLISSSGPAWLATAGSGDVLAGIVGALLAQQNEGMLQHNPEKVTKVAACAAYLHGLAGQIASGTGACGWQPPQIFESDEPGKNDDMGHPIVASDIIDAIPAAINQLLSRGKSA